MARASLHAARTIAFTTLVCAKLIQTFTWRQEGSSESIGDCMKDRYFVGALAISFLTLLATIYVLSLSTLFHMISLAFKQWIKILLVAGSVTTVSRMFLMINPPLKKQENSIPHLPLAS